MFCRQLIVFVWLPTFCDWWRRLRRTCGERNWRRSDSLEIGHPSCHPTSSGPTLRDCVDAWGAKLTASGFLDAHARHFCHLTDRFRANRDVWERNRWQLDSLDTRRFYITHSSSANSARALRKCFGGAKLTSTGVLRSRALPVTRHWAPRGSVWSETDFDWAVCGPSVLSVAEQPCQSNVKMLGWKPMANGFFKGRMTFLSPRKPCHDPEEMFGWAKLTCHST